VEADGEWHSSDNKYASARWKASHPAIAPVQSSPPRKTAPYVKSSSHTPIQTNGKERPSDVEIVVLDSDDEDEGRVKRELSPSFGSGSSGSINHSFNRVAVPMTQSQEDIIDLTLDSDSDDNHPILSRTTEKRKITEEDVSPHALQPSKKPRVDDTQCLSRSMAIRTLTDSHISSTTSTATPVGDTFRSNSAQFPSYSGPHSPTQVSPIHPSSLPSRIHIRFDGPNYPPPTYSHHRNSSPVVSPSARSPQSHSPTYSYRLPRVNSRWL
jgi:E3 SUMO-protein ligase PIAS1